MKTGLQEGIDVHGMIYDKELKKELTDKFGTDHRRRKGVLRHIELLARVGQATIKKSRAGFSLHDSGKSDLPSIDLFHYFKMDFLEIEDAIRVGKLNAEQVYNIDRTRQALETASSRPLYRGCIESMKRKGYDWKDYVKP